MRIVFLIVFITLFWLGPISAVAETPGGGGEDEHLNSFEVDWKNFIGFFSVFALVALMIERALYQIFDSKLWKLIEEKLDDQVGGNFMDLKPWISVAICVAIAFRFRVDFIAVVLGQTADPLSMVLTGLFLAGGSTGIYKFLKRAREVKDAGATAQVAKLKPNRPNG